ncbi:NifB/NifX family molybdenum-iron cluster-binding protein [Candidatus Bipolaricaulota bacterium]|nr:NifB/NifX family molybdenum-iron cluster-binding protein [Candidatus Bipolaricaulota bacterium]
MQPIVACGTSDGKNLFKDHFGAAPYFYLYKINVQGFEFIEEIENISRADSENEEPGGKLKAKNISSLLKSKSANVLVSHQMGPHLAKISKDFVPIISRELDIDAALNSVREKLHLVEREWRKGENQKYLVLEESS